MRPQLRWTILCLAAAACAWAAVPAQAQGTSARRLAMGGVSLARGGPGGDIVNVAYRAVPPAPGDSPSGFSLPIGLIPVLQDPPSFDPDDSTFSPFRLANLALHPPWNLALVEPSEPAGDVTVSIGRNALSVDLGNLREVIPDERVRFASVARGPALVVGVRRAFVGIGPLVHAQNDLNLNNALREALRDGQPFLPNTDYTLDDRARGQAAAQAMVGAAFPLLHTAGADERGGFYVGARAKLLRGLAYGDADEAVGFTTPDTLFGNAPVDVHYTGRMRSALPADGGWGSGFDAGAVWVLGTFELGLAANDLGTRIAWRVEERVTVQDSVSGEYRTSTVAEDVPFTSTVPASYLVTATTRVGGVLVAADLQRGALDQVTGHAGLECWVGRLALRAGASVDPQHRVQVAGGAGLRFGRIGLDLAVATNQSNLMHERAVDLGAGLSFYPSRHR